MSDHENDAPVTEEHKEQHKEPKVKTEPKQPAPQVARRAGSVAEVAEALHSHPLHETISNTFYWRDPVRSGLVLAIITLVWFLMTIVEYSATTLVAYLYLGIFVTSFALVHYSNMTGKAHPLKTHFGDLSDVISSEDYVSSAGGTFKVLDAFVRLSRDALFFTDVALSLKAFGIVLSLAIASHFISLPTMLFIDAVVLFTLPRIYEEQRQNIDMAMSKLFAAVNEKAGPVLAKFPSDALKLKHE
jgi:hypothetical protein